jgi:hypothetical protein
MIASTPASMIAPMTASSPPKISSAICASCLLVALAVSVAASGAAAASPDKYATAAKHRGPYAKIAMHRARGVRGGREYPNIPPNAIRMPGYIFVPGVGILDESCDLPTSSCPNEYRDVQ